MKFYFLGSGWVSQHVDSMLTAYHKELVPNFVHLEQLFAA